MRTVRTVFLLVLLCWVGVSDAPGQAGEIRELLERAAYAEALEAAEQSIESEPDELERAGLIDLWLEALGGTQQDDARADSLATWAIELKSERYGEDAPEVGLTHYGYARWLDIRTRYDTAMEHVLTAISIFGESQDTRWRELARSIDLQALILEKQGELDQARSVARRAAGLWEEHGEGESPDAARTFGHLARIENRLGHVEEARDLYLRSLAILEADPESSAADRAVAHNNLSNIYRLLDDHESAVREGQIALELYQEALGPDHPRVALAMGNLANVYLAYADFAQAARMYSEGLALSERALGPEHRQCGVFLYNLGRLQHTLGDEAAARASFERAREIFVNALGPEHEFVARLLGLEANVCYAEGDYVGAAELATEALEMKRRTLGPEHQQLAATWRTLARIRMGLGDEAAAERALAEAREVLLATSGPEHSEFASLLELEADLAEEQGRYADAAQARSEAERILLANNPHFTVEIADLRRKRALALAREGDPGGARALLDSTLASQIELHGLAHPAVGATRRSRAAVLLAAGDPVGAEEDLREAIGLYSSAYGEIPLIAELYAAIAVARHQQGNDDAALESALESEQISRRTSSVTLLGLTEREAILYAQKQQVFVDLVLTLPAGGNTDARWSVVAATRGRVAREMARRYELARSTEDPELAEAFAALAVARSRLAQLYSQGQADRTETEYAGALDAVRAEKESAESAVAWLGHGWTEADPVEPARFTKLNASQDQAIAWTFHQRLAIDDPRALLQPLAGEERCRAFIARDGSAGEVDLGPAETVVETVDRWRGLVQTPPPSIASLEQAAAEELRLAGERLRQAVYDPVLDYAVTGRTFLISDGALHLANPMALPGPTGAELVGAGLDIRFLNDESELAPRDRGGELGSALALANPDFGGELVVAEARSVTGPPQTRAAYLDCAGLATTGFSPLPASGRELAAIERAGSRRDLDITVLDGVGATEASFRSLAPGQSLLHLGTHAYFLGAECLDPNDELASAHPLLLSGLVLARGDGSADRTSENDGLLSAEEITALDLESTRLAVLAACQTGEGIVRRGEGVIGLRRAFRLAGCEGLVLSLWPVEDEPTARWMELFYSALLIEELGAAESAQAASLRLRDERAEQGASIHPVYWAGFMFAGTD